MTEVTWNRKQTILLLELFKQCPNLYDKRNSLYLNRVERKRTLHTIADRLKPFRPNTTLLDVNRKIQTLKAQFYKELHKINLAENNEEVYLPKLWCYEYMKFFGDFDNMSFHRNRQKCNLESSHGVEQQNTPEDSTNSDVESEESKNTESENSLCCDIVNSETSKLLETTIQLVQSLSKRINEKKVRRNVAFEKFINEELNSIEDQLILEETKWSIQLSLHTALQKQKNKQSKQTGEVYI